ncbi:MAG: hypothetical protein ABEJ80_04335 [Halarchaeum sp.]
MAHEARELVEALVVRFEFALAAFDGALAFDGAGVVDADEEADERAERENRDGADGGVEHLVPGELDGEEVEVDREHREREDAERQPPEQARERAVRYERVARQEDARPHQEQREDDGVGLDEPVGRVGGRGEVGEQGEGERAPGRREEPAGQSSALSDHYPTMAGSRLSS